MSSRQQLDWGERNEEITANQLDSLKGMVRKILVEIEAMGMSPNFDVGGGIDFYDAVQKFEVSLIKSALLRTGGHQSRAAKLLGIKKTTLNAKIKHYNIEWKAVIFENRQEEKEKDDSVLLLHNSASHEANPQWYAAAAIGEQENALR
jgi:DNA-binding protein Fis